MTVKKEHGIKIYVLWKYLKYIFYVFLSKWYPTKQQLYDDELSIFSKVHLFCSAIIILNDDKWF